MIANFAFSQQDAEGCKEHPMLPNRMQNYYISECKHNYDAVEFNLASERSEMATKEGTNSWWLIVFPGAAIFLSVTMYNLIGEGLRDALDPKLKK